ncbi:beta-galactosidase [Spirochaetia bacterium]|nr:beta-galactosidase [Spirochaetia bacterium]
MKTVFYQDGNPFLPFGSQVHNSNVQSPEGLEIFWRAQSALGGNTAEIPIYWEYLEPEEGHFDFSQTDMVLESARKHNSKLILLWFGTWKNGKMEYTPPWVKENPDRFHRVITHDGFRTGVLSSHCKANLNADIAAFTALMNHIKERDDQGTVIAVQVENEPGINARSMRDHGPEGEAEYQADVDAGIMNLLAGLPEKSRVRQAWQEAGGASSGNWRKVFGRHGSEFLSAWSLGTYINNVAKAGKAIHKLPMIVNVWNGDGGFNQPGMDYPSGGAAAKVLDLWKFVSPDIDIIGPDIYLDSIKQNSAVCAAFCRTDNLLFVPESPRWKTNEWAIFNAIGNYDAVGYFMFGAEDILDEQGAPRPELLSTIDSFNMIKDALPLIVEHHGKIHTIIQEEGMAAQLIDLDGYSCSAKFTPPEKLDFRHRYPSIRSGERGRGFLFQTGKNEFYCVGDGFYLDLRKKQDHKGDMVDFENFQKTSHVNFITVENGHFDSEKGWQADYRRNGDDVYYGIWMYADVHVTRFVMQD